MKRTTAFTLMEMILVVVIIGLLAALVLPKITGWGRRASNTAAAAQIDGFKTALSNFERACGRYPTTTEGLRALVERPTGLPESAEWERFLEERTVPKDPWGQDYLYRCPGTVDPDGYDLFAVGPDGQEGTDDDIGNTRP